MPGNNIQIGAIISSLNHHLTGLAYENPLFRTHLRVVFDELPCLVIQDDERCWPTQLLQPLHSRGLQEYGMFLARAIYLLTSF